ncbi:hypothetical protein Rumeso_00530 [Rubellimicrobium mesophilum DSM 19309]|uniref:Uncharacterized protein n=1 Tax=Rubellimicrobium mesophilum DSM 19309 TaxID=442562 RepID=A0A017HUG2_9RHOB|nr:hypothetical protein Rumeso_00530 [Rubellimicrobium mesophilum DSM 19309]
MAVAVLGLAGGAEAGGFAPVGTVRTVTAPVVAAPTPLEWLRQVGPQVGQNVRVPANGGYVPGIEWHRDVQVRVRTRSGALLTPAEQASIRAQALICGRGEVRAPMARVEPNGTLVIDYDCAWLQGS